MNKSKKCILTLGSILSASVPIFSVISCGKNNSKAKTVSSGKETSAKAGGSSNKDATGRSETVPSPRQNQPNLISTTKTRPTIAEGASFKGQEILSWNRNGGGKNYEDGYIVLVPFTNETFRKSEIKSLFNEPESGTSGTEKNGSKLFVKISSDSSKNVKYADDDKSFKLSENSTYVFYVGIRGTKELELRTRIIVQTYDGKEDSKHEQLISTILG